MRVAECALDTGPQECTDKKNLAERATELLHEEACSSGQHSNSGGWLISYNAYDWQHMRVIMTATSEAESGFCSLLFTQSMQRVILGTRGAI